MKLWKLEIRLGQNSEEAKSVTEFGNLSKHVDDISRIRQLNAIEGKLKVHAFPPQLVVENTSYCNLKCIHCSHKEMHRPQKHMTRSLWNKIASEIGRESPECELWPTFYGEALILGDELWDRLDLAANAGCRNIVLNSNGTLLNRNDNISKILSSPIRRFILSLDGLSKETFEQIRYKAKWENVYPGVEELCRKRQELGINYPLVITQFSVMKENISEIEAFRNHWQRIGAEVKFRPMLEWGAVGSVRSETIEHHSSFRIACPWAINTMAIHQNGDVVACAVDYDGNYKTANICDVTLKEAWRQLELSFRRLHREHLWDELPCLCRGCGDWQTAGAEYEAETVSGTRPFWYYGSG